MELLTLDTVEEGPVWSVEEEAEEADEEEVCVLLLLLLLPLFLCRCGKVMNDAEVERV